jgi:hypothetical protein
MSVVDDAIDWAVSQGGNLASGGTSVFDLGGLVDSILGDDPARTAAAAGLGAAGLAFAKEAYDKVGEVGREAYETYSQPGGLADVLSDRLEFRPYTVTSPTGSRFGMLTQGAGGERVRPIPGDEASNTLGTGTGQNVGTYNDANTSPEVRAAINAGASSNYSASELAAFNLGARDLNQDGRISTEEFRQWPGYEAWAQQQGGRWGIADETRPGGIPGSRFTGRYDNTGNPIYIMPDGSTVTVATFDEWAERSGVPTYGVSPGGYRYTEQDFNNFLNSGGIDANNNNKIDPAEREAHKGLLSGATGGTTDPVIDTTPADQGADIATAGLGYGVSPGGYRYTEADFNNFLRTGGIDANNNGQIDPNEREAHRALLSGEPDFAGDLDFLLNLSPDERKFYEDRLAGASNMFDLAENNAVTVIGPDGTPRVISREQQVYERMRAAQTPEEERERLALEQRLANQGRLGTRTAMFGGTPEQLALAKAQEEAKNQAMLTAMQFAGEEQQRQAALGSGMLGAAYIPQAQLLNALQPGMTTAEQMRQAQQAQATTYGQTYASGVDALLASGLGQANLAGGFGSSLATTALGSLFS